jgi:two-component system LytT family sensor kinase
MAYDAPASELERQPAPAKRLGVQAAALIILWTIPGLLCALQVYTGGVLLRGRSYTWGAILWYALPVWWLWIPFTLAALGLARRFPMERGRRLRGLLVHLPASLIFALLHLLFYAYWIEVAAPYEARLTSLLERTVFLANDVWLHVDLLAYWAILGGYFAFDYYRKYRERELRASRLETRLAEAQLQALRMQLHPHFLFNTLNAISAFMEKEPRTARRMMAELGELLRFSLDHADRQEITLAEELDFLENYLNIERMRFEDQLSVEVNAEAETLEALVPGFLLQPLVENAIRHGITTRAAAGRIEVRAARRDGMLSLQVRDDGVGLTAGWRLAEHGGVGLSNTVARLEHLYPDQHVFRVESAPGDGVLVDIALPFRTPTSTPRP